MTGEALIARARDFIGAEFSHHSATPERCDCLGLILGPARDVGLTRAVLPAYGRGVAPAVLLEGLGAELVCLWQNPKEGEFAGPLVEAGWRVATVGDVLCLAIASERGKPHPRHLAYWTGDALLHADTGHGVIEQPPGVKWRRRLHSVWRWKGLAG